MKFPCKAVIVATDISDYDYRRYGVKYPNIGDIVNATHDELTAYRFTFKNDEFSWFKYKIRLLDFNTYYNQAKTL